MPEITDAAWDNLGIAFGGVACVAIGSQILNEWRTPPPSTVSSWFAAGFLLIYVFWFCYGVKFRRRGIWLPNIFAILLQATLAAIILCKL
jgi:hypothetical protein